MARSLPAPAWMAEQFINTNTVRWYAEDVFHYEPGTGLYRPVSRGWLPARVQNFLIEMLGSGNVSAYYVGEVCRCIHHLTYLDERIRPPFRVSTGTPLNAFLTANGLLSLDTLVTTGSVDCVPHDPDVFSLCGVPYSYDPQVTCPRWEAFTHWMVGGNKGEVQLLQQFCAWVFIRPQLPLEKILWLCGPGRNGKSTWLKAVRYALGEASTSAVGLEAFGGAQRFRLWPTLDKIANFCTDATVKRSSGVASLNAFVSGDPITLNRKFREQLTVTPSTVCFFASNPLPLYDDPSDAFWRRLLLLDLRQQVPEDQADPGLLTELHKEAAGILNWMLAAVPQLLAQRAFTVPASVSANVEALKGEVSSSRQFIREKLTAADPDRDFVSRDHVMALFGVWCDTNGLPRESMRTMKHELRAAFPKAEFTRRRRGLTPGERAYGWAGVAWKPEEQVREMTAATAQQGDYLQRCVEQQDQEIVLLRQQLQQLQAKVALPPPPAPPAPASSRPAPTPTPATTAQREVQAQKVVAMLEKLRAAEAEGQP